MKGVILAGGSGSRLKPMTSVMNKHLLPVYDRPMILYPIETLKSMGITDILLITGGNHLGSFVDFLGDGGEFGINLTYKIQKDAGGIAHALLLSEYFVGHESVAVILGDNIFEYAPTRPDKGGCGIVLKEVYNPKRFGVYFDGEIEEKPENPKSSMVVTGLYFYTHHIFDFIKTLKTSARGELEITDVNNWCLKNRKTEIIEYKGFWSDAGTPESLLHSSNFYGKKE